MFIDINVQMLNPVFCFICIVHTTVSKYFVDLLNILSVHLLYYGFAADFVKSHEADLYIIIQTSINNYIVSILFHQHGGRGKARLDVLVVMYNSFVLPGTSLCADEFFILC